MTSTARLIGAALLALCMSGLALAATPAAAQVVKYGPAGFWGGYKEKEVEPGVWQVSASLNAASGGGQVAAAMANYRAAELMKAKGFSHMRVLKHGGFELDLGKGAGYGAGPGYAHLTVRGATGEADTEGCREKSADKCRTLAVDEVMAWWKPYLRFRDQPAGG